jgi:hypothetical protein
MSSWSLDPGPWTLVYRSFIFRAGEVIAPRKGGGKSELRRARRSRNGTGGDPMDSATEKKTAPHRGKGETVG